MKKSPSPSPSSAPSSDDSDSPSRKRCLPRLLSDADIRELLPDVRRRECVMEACRQVSLRFPDSLEPPPGCERKSVQEVLLELDSEWQIPFEYSGAGSGKGQKHRQPALTFQRQLDAYLQARVPRSDMAKLHKNSPEWVVMRSRCGIHDKRRVYDLLDPLYLPDDDGDQANCDHNDASGRSPPPPPPLPLMSTAATATTAAYPMTAAMDAAVCAPCPAPLVSAPALSVPPPPFMVQLRLQPPMVPQLSPPPMMQHPLPAFCSMMASAMHSPPQLPPPPPPSSIVAPVMAARTPTTPQPQHLPTPHNVPQQHAYTQLSSIAQAPGMTPQQRQQPASYTTAAAAAATQVLQPPPFALSHEFVVGARRPVARRSNVNPPPNMMAEAVHAEFASPNSGGFSMFDYLLTPPSQQRSELGANVAAKQRMCAIDLFPELVHLLSPLSDE